MNISKLNTMKRTSNIFDFVSASGVGVSPYDKKYEKSPWSGRPKYK